MSLFKRKARRSTTISMSDRTRQSKGSLSSFDGKISSQGSTLSLKVTGSQKIGSVPSVKSESKIKHARFTDDTTCNDGSCTPSINGNDISPSGKYFTADHAKKGTFFNNPGVSEFQETEAPTAGAPMELYASVIKGDKAELKKIITGNKELLDTADNFGRTPLMYCVLADRLDCAKYLINMGCKLDQVDNAGRSATHSAAHKGSYKFLELLHNRGASLDIKDDDGQTPLHLVTRNRTPKCLEYLLRNLGPGMVDVSDNQLRTALHWSAAFNNTECVKLLIKYGINIALTDTECKTPLHWAANNLDPSTVQTMAAILEKSPSVLNWQDNDGRTALHYAVAHGNSDAVEFLVNFQAEEFSEMFECDPDRSDFTHRTPLHWAAQLGHINVVELLLKGNAKISSSDGNGATPFLYAALTDKHNVVEAMIAHNPKVMEQADIEGRNALMWAAGKGCKEVVRTLLGIRKPATDKESNNDGSVRGVDDSKTVQVLEFTPMEVNKLDNKGNTALHAAARNGHGALVEILLKNGAKHKLANTETHHTPIFGACEKGHVNCVTYLLDYKASVRIIDSENRTPLHWAALGGHAEVCDLLLQEGLDVDVRDKLERTPLHCAAVGAFINCMNLLLENGANVDVQDQAGHSALHWAAQSGHQDAIKLLFQHSVFPNPMEYTEERLTPLDYALQKENEDVMHYLIEQGALSAEHIRNIAAMRIQAYFRGYKVRRTKEILMRTLALRKEKRKQIEAKENSAATRIQAYYRGYQVRKNLHFTNQSIVTHKFDSYHTTTNDKAATKIQAYYRGYIARRDYPHRKSGTSTMKEESMTANDVETELPEVNCVRDSNCRKVENGTPTPEIDSGSHSPEHEADVSFTAKDDTARDLNVFSNDEGVICDQASTSSSHSTISCKQTSVSERNGITTSRYSVDDSTHKTDDSNRNLGENVARHTFSSAKGANNDRALNSKSTESSRSFSNLGAQLPTSEDHLTTSCLPQNVVKIQPKKIQKRKTKKTRSKLLSKPEVFDSDSSKEHFPSNKYLVAPKETCPSKSIESSIKVKSKQPSRDVTRKWNPSPPTHLKETKPRKKRLLVPKKDRSKRFYPALDNLGDKDNIQSENVSGVARCSELDSLYYMDELPAVPKTPFTRARHREFLGLSEYIESLMTMSPTERRRLKEHQDKRRNAFRLANHAASIIQRAWVRHLRHKNPSLHKKFLTARRKAKRQQQATETTSPDYPVIQEELENKHDKHLEHLEKAVGSPMHSKSVTKRNDNDRDVSEMTVHTTPPETVKASFASASDVASNSSGRKSMKAKRPKTSNHGATFISLERLEELSRIYGNPKMMRDLLSNAGRSNTSLPSITSSPTKSIVDAPRPMTAANTSRHVFEKSLRGTAAYMQPTSSFQSTRPWYGLPSVSGKSRLTVSASNGPRNLQRSTSGRAKANVDYRMMPLQWQKLYGELQNANATDSKRKNFARFSYNVGEVG